MPNIAKETLPELCQRLDTLIRKAGEKTGMPVPDDSVALLESLFIATKKTVRYRKSPKKNGTDREKYLLKMLQWNRGDTGGSLYGPMMAQFLVQDASERDHLDNLAMLLLAVTRGPQALVAAERWHQAIYGR